jgi:hypothetical protein
MLAHLRGGALLFVGHRDAPDIAGVMA